MARTGPADAGSRQLRAVSGLETQTAETALHSRWGTSAGAARRETDPARSLTIWSIPLERFTNAGAKRCLIEGRTRGSMPRGRLLEGYANATGHRIRQGRSMAQPSQRREKTVRSEIVIDEENSAGMRTAGRILVWFGTVLPAWLVRRTPIMVWILKFLAFLGGSSDRLKRARRNAAFARRNNLPRSQYDAPGISYLHRAGHRVPLILPTYAQRHRYEQERLTVQYRTKVFNQVSWFFRGGPLPETRLPEADLQEWFRALLVNTGAHWYLERVTDGDGEAALRWTSRL